MKKTELLTAVEDFMSVKEITLEMFYDIRITKYYTTLQGEFDVKITKALFPLFNFALTEYGHLAGELTLPVEGSEETILLRVVLT